MLGMSLKKFKIVLLSILTTLLAACVHQENDQVATRPEPPANNQDETKAHELEHNIVKNVHLQNNQTTWVLVEPDLESQDQTEVAQPDQALVYKARNPKPGNSETKGPLDHLLADARSAASRLAPSQPAEFKQTRLPMRMIRPITDIDRENYAHYQPNPVKDPNADPVSTFSIDVDTGSYANVRRMLSEGHLPPAAAVRAEELINYFNYQYPGPDQRQAQEQPFNVITELAPSPWRDASYLMHIGIQAYTPERDERPAANLVFLVDVSGSMSSPNKLGLLKNAMKMLSKQLDENDRVAIVVYAGASGIVLEPTVGNNFAAISNALNQLAAGGSTNGSAGIELAYQLAEQSLLEDGINRVILATDGDFNVGTVNFDQLKQLISRKRKSGIALTTLGFGSGNYNDQLMEQLADAGNGNYFYIDSLSEGRKVLVEELGSTLQILAKDVKIQVEFNPEVVAEYRQIGYENRALKREDFNNDSVDAGEIGAGHSVTALYEITFQGSSQHLVDPLRYQQEQNHRSISPIDTSSEIAFLKLRYKKPQEQQSRLISQAILYQDRTQQFDHASQALRFSAAVAGFSQLLQTSDYLSESFSYQQVAELALKAKGNDPHGYRGEFHRLVKLAESLDQIQHHAAR